MKALRGVGIGLGIGLLVVGALLAVYNAGRRSATTPAPVAPVSAPPPAPPPTATAPAPLPPPEPVDPILALVVRARIDLRRLEGLDERTRDASLRHWDESSEITYAMLARGADAHFESRECFRGVVEEIHDLPSGGVVMRLRVGGYDDVLWVESVMRPDDDVVARSRVRACGYIAGTHTYESQAGWNITLPSMLAVWVDRRR